MDFSPQKGREQSGLRPALVLSAEIYNKHSGLVLVCPITSISKGYPFEVKIPAQNKVKGVVLADHIKSLDWRSRYTKFLCKAPASVCIEVVDKVAVLIGN